MWKFNINKVMPVLFILLFSCENKTPTLKVPLEVKHTEVESLKNKIKGQKVYVPIYSVIHTWRKDRFIELTAIMSIRNISTIHNIVITKADYYDTNGKFIRNYLQKPILLNPLATKEFIIQEDDIEGGTGANYIVEWESDQNVSSPIIEAVMISTKGQQGISFVSRGVAIEEHN